MTKLRQILEYWPAVVVGLATVTCCALAMQTGATLQRMHLWPL